MHSLCLIRELRGNASIHMHLEHSQYTYPLCLSICKHPNFEINFCNSEKSLELLEKQSKMSDFAVDLDI